MTSSALASYYEVSPNSQVEGCMVTGEPGPGVVFHNVETMSGDVCFIGEQAVTEAFAEISGVTPAKLKKLVTATQEVDALKKHVNELERQLAFWAEFKAKAADAGMIIEELE